MYDDLIARWATETPDRPAVITPRGDFGFATFDRQINMVAARLQALNLRPGARVVVLAPDDYAHWLQLLALDRLGMASVSLAVGQADELRLAALKPDLVVTTPEAGLRTSVRTVEASTEWVNELPAGAPAALPPRRRQPDEIVRIFSSSGSTGTPKLMAFTRAQVQARIAASQPTYRAGPQSRGCMLMGPGTSGGYLWSLAFWSAGGSVMLNTRFGQSFGHELNRAMPTHLVIAPGTLLNLMRNTAADLSPMPSLEIHVAGSILPRVLAAEVARKLSPNIVMRYAAAEVGMMALGSVALLERHDGTAGYIAPSAEVQVVDRDGRVLPPGVTGILRARTAGMFSGYLNDAKGTAAVLRDGWFYPGDLGSLSADGLLLVEGRDTEIMNIGGDKYAPHVIEEVALGCAGIRDAAAFSVPNEFGVEVPWVAVVRGEGHRDGEVMGKLLARWPGLAGVQIAVIASIPRNQMGKIERLTLRHQALAWTKARAG